MKYTLILYIIKKIYVSVINMLLIDCNIILTVNICVELDLN